MEDKEILKMLFEEHHRQYTSRWQIVHNITKGTVTLFFLITGWILLAQTPISLELKPFIIIFVVVASLLSCLAIVISIHNIKKIAKVIVRINMALEFFEVGRYLSGESLYPEDWKNFGRRKYASTFGNVAIVIIGALMSICAVLIRM